MLLTFEIKKQLIRRTDKEIPVAKSENYLYAQFSFSEEWEGTKTAIFNNGTPYSIQLDNDNKCLVPWEVITESGFSVSVFCGERITANVSYVDVLPSGYIEGQTPAPPSPTVYDQLTEAIEQNAEAIGDLDENKQNKLTAGDNITIIDDVISATGGSSVQVDEVTLTDDNGTLKVKTGGIDTTQIKNGAVTSDKVASALMSVINGKANQYRTVYTPESEYISISSFINGVDNYAIYDITAPFTLVLDVSDQIAIEVAEGSIIIADNLSHGGYSLAVIGGGLYEASQCNLILAYKPYDEDLCIVTGEQLAYLGANIDTKLAGKQDTLTAGDNITIQNNVISASSGSSAYTFDFDLSQSGSSFIITPRTGVTYSAIVSALAETPNVYANVHMGNATYTALFTYQYDVDSSSGVISAHGTWYLTLPSYSGIYEVTIYWTYNNTKSITFTPLQVLMNAGQNITINNGTISAGIEVIEI